MVRYVYLIVILMCSGIPSAFALLSMELTRGVSGAIPIAIVPFQETNSARAVSVSDVITQDLKNSGRFKVTGRGAITQFPVSVDRMAYDYFRGIGTDFAVVGRVEAMSAGRYQVHVQLVDVLQGQGQAPASRVLLAKGFTVGEHELRQVAHRIADSIYEKLIGVRGIFSTKLAYVLVQPANENAQERYVLEVSDHDGYNPRPLLRSPEPIMSPAWSPNGRHIAYVSFENKRAQIVVQDVMSGARNVVSAFAGINGAPAWSPDGRKLALVLSKTGSPNIYVMDIGSRQLKQMTSDFYLNTEPSWSPDGSKLLYTSNRGGSPQLYELQIGSGASTRLTFDGDYNARGAYSHDGKTVVMIHRAGGMYRIALLDLETGRMRVLSQASRDSSSPSIAPNGSMILYDTQSGNRNVLAMVSADGSVQVTLPARHGSAQDPAWSP